MARPFRFPTRLCLALLCVLCLSRGAALADTAYPTLESLGEALFFDENFSLNRTQSCATCHDPDQAFTDSRVTRVGKAVSLGDDGQSLGDRTAPTAAYAAHVPTFHFDGGGVL